MKLWSISKNSGRVMAQRKYGHLRVKCEQCGSTKGRIEIHHKDRDPRNNSPANIAILCQSCHIKEHLRTKDWGKGQVSAAKCQVCGVTFQPTRARRATLCGSQNCAKTYGRRCALKRWKGSGVRHS